MRLLVTGASGFVGTAVVRRMMHESRIDLRAAVRRESSNVDAGVKQVIVGELTPETDWTRATARVDTVLHLAARVHVMRETAADPLAEFREANVAATLNLARQAALAGARRFVFLSSVKVNGNAGVFTEDDVPAPQDPYGISKHEAEIGLRHVSAETGMEVVVIRPPLVYGPGVKANFRSLMRAVARGLPLPFGAIRNRRSYVAVDNLVDFIDVCLDRAEAANQTFLVSDGEDLSTTELIRRLGIVMGRKTHLVPIPAPLLMAVATIAGRRDMAERLLGTVQVDISKARRLLHWAPPVSVNEGLRRAAAALA